MKQECDKKHNFSCPYEDVGAHEVAESAVGVAPVLGEDEEVGAHVEQEEYQEECSKQCQQ